MPVWHRGAGGCERGQVMDCCACAEVKSALRCAVCSARQQSTDLEMKQMSVQRGDRNLLKFQG